MILEDSDSKGTQKIHARSVDFHYFDTGLLNGPKTSFLLSSSKVST